ncbi:MAG: hypothetical protein DVB28_000191 [Verrucomicrobia bacterium]|nr:MAG: hypothetical protein DVB28_000191 [Verrucomicrobiota bacterium]
MSEFTNQEDKGQSLALAGIALVAVLFFGTQLRVGALEKPMLEAQLNYSAQRLTATKSAQTQADESLKKRDEQMKALSETEAKYAALLTELIELAKTDVDARAITQKWKIQQQGQAGAAESSVQDTKPVKVQPVAPQPPKPKAP